MKTSAIRPAAPLIRMATPAEFEMLVNEAYRGAEAGSHIVGRESAEMRPGELYLCNETRFIEDHFSEPLTTYATGWVDGNDIAATLEHIAPNVPVSRRFEFAKATNAEEFLSETDDVRAIGANFKRIEYTSAKVNSKTLNKGLTIRVDMDNVDEQPNWKNMVVRRIMQRLLRNELRRAVTLLLAAATNTPLTWDTTALKNPDMDIQTLGIAFQDAAGVPANRALYGRIAWNKRQIAHEAQNTAGGFAAAQRTPDMVAAYLGLDAVKVSNERYQLTSSTKSKVVPDVVVLYNGQSNQSPDDPSTIKRFTSMTKGGSGLFRVYEQLIGSKFTDITVEHYSNIVVTSTLGVQKATIS